MEELREREVYMGGNKISVEEASGVLGISPAQIRYYMRAGRFNPPIGQVRKVPGRKSYRYDVYKAKVMEYAGLKEWPGEERSEG